MPATSTSRWRRPDARLERLDLALGDDPAAADDHDVLAHLLDEVELVRPEHDADARPRPARGGPRSSSRCRSGRGRENGSSSTSSSGSWTSAVASWTRCWLPCERSSSLDFARSASPNRSSHALARAVASSPRQAVVLAEVGELLADAHPRVEAALLGHVPEPQPRRRRRPAARPSGPSPASGVASPKMQRIVVVLPAPFGPRKPTRRPRRAVNDAPSSAVTGP